MISFYFHIPYPERLSLDVWCEKIEQLKWLARQGILGVKL
nr:MAG TPA: hypothetical protein [Caudoviricetes sp.]